MRQVDISNFCLFAVKFRVMSNRWVSTSHHAERTWLCFGDASQLPSSWTQRCDSQMDRTGSVSFSYFSTHASHCYHLSLHHDPKLVPWANLHWLYQPKFELWRVLISRLALGRALATSQSVQIHPSSGLFRTKPDCVIFNELVRTTQNYVKNLTRIDPLWLAELAPQYYATEDWAWFMKRLGE